MTGKKKRKNVGSNDRRTRCPEERKFRQRMERFAADPADVRRSPIELSIDPPGETVFRMVARCASGGRTAIELRRYRHRQTADRSTVRRAAVLKKICRSSKLESFSNKALSDFVSRFGRATGFFSFFIFRSSSALLPLSGGDTTCGMVWSVRFFFFF